MSKDKDNLVYWEERTINIGNYESVKCGLNYSAAMRSINRTEGTITISEMASQKIGENQEDFVESIKLMQSRVRKVLDAREADIRMRSERFVDDFSPTGKALMLKVIDAVKYRKKHKKLAAEAQDIEDLENEVEDSVFDDE